MIAKKFVWRWLNVLVVASLLLGMLPFEALAVVAPVTGTPPESAPAAYSPQARRAEVLLYLPLVLRGYAAGALPVTLNQYAAPWLLLPGDVTTYTLVVQNPGTYPVQSGELTAEAPEAVSPVVGSISADGVYEAQSRQVRWNLPELAGGAAQTVTFRAQVTANAVMTATSMAFLTATLSAGQMFTDSDPAHVSVGEAVTQTLTAAGGTLTAPDHKATLVAPAGAVTQTTPVRVASFPTPFELGELPYRWQVLFDVTAVGAAGELLRDADGHTRFLQPLTATINVESTWEQPFLVHMTGAALEERTPVEIEFDHEADVLTATLQTFSAYGAGGADPYAAEGTYHLMTNQPGVGMFNGAATYGYQFDAPAGRRGLTPKLSLNYSNSGMNSLLGIAQSGDVGMGWNLGGQVQIVRPIKTYDAGGRVVWQYTNEFVLTINGASYNLEDYTVIPGPYGCRYDVTDGPGLKVMRYTVPGANNQYCGYPAIGTPPSNGTGEYWEVTTGDGTVYRLGYDRNSQQLMRMSWYGHSCSGLRDCGGWSPHFSFGGYAGELTKLVAYRWAVDEVHDVYGNVMKYGYHRETRFFHDGEDYWYDRGFHLEWIRYGGNLAQGVSDMYVVDFVLESRTNANDNGAGALHDSGLDHTTATSFPGTDWSMWDSLRVDRVRVCVNPGGDNCNAGTLLADYDLDYEFVKEESRKHIYTTRLQSITRSAPNETGAMIALPATAFSYVSLSQDHPTMHYALNYPRLRTVDNGYGGVTTFTYEAVAQGYLHKSFYGDYHHIYTSHRVKTQTTDDGLGHTSTVSYSYGAPCFNLWRTSDSCAYPGSEADFSLTGHDLVVQEVRGYSGELLARILHGFHSGRDEGWRLGREKLSLAYDADSTSFLQLTETEWTKEEVGSTTFTYASVVTSTDFTGGTPLTTWQEYRYDPSFQGGKQYGLLTHMIEYGSQNVRRRISLTNYVINEDAWLLLPWANSVFDGKWGWEVINFHLYDNNTDPDAQALTKGALTSDRSLLVETSACPADNSTVDTAYQYDAYGNIAATTTYSGYGVMHCDPITSTGGIYWSPVGGLGNGSASRRSEVTYDSIHHIFPIETCAAAGTLEEQCSEVEYYGVNGNASVCDSSGDFFGAVCRAWGSNGPDTAAHYHYDAFGRKIETWLPGESVTGIPSERIQYRDVTDPDWRPMLVTVWNRHIDASSFYSENVTLWQRVFYDGLGRAVQTHTPTEGWTYDGDGDDIVQDTLYDGLGRTVSQSVPYTMPSYYYDDNDPQNPYYAPHLNQPHTNTKYDMLGRPVQVVSPDVTTTTLQYAGRETTVIDANGHQMRQTVDDFGRMVKVEEFTGTVASATVYATTQYAYDALDNLVMVTDTRQHTTTMRYDGLGRKTAMDDPDMGEWSYAYNPAGSLLEQTDARGCVITFEYDQFERLTGKSYGGAAGCVQPSVAYTYDEGGATQFALGQRTGMTYAGGETSYAYDLRGRLVNTAQAFSGTTYTTGYTYDDMNRPVRITYPDGEVVTTTYNNAGYPVKLAGQDSKDYVLNTRYNELGTPTEMLLGNGAVTRWKYWGVDAWEPSQSYNYGRLARIETRGITGALLMDKRYDYDAVGNVVRLSDAPEPVGDWPITDTFSDTFTMLNGDNWNWQGQTLVSEDGNSMVKSTGTGADYSVQFNRTSGLFDEKGFELRFKVTTTHTISVYDLVSVDGGVERRFGVVAGMNTAYIQYKNGDAYAEDYSAPLALLQDLKLNTWYVVRVVKSAGPGFYAEIFREGHPEERGSYSMWMDVPSGLQWQFRHWIWQGAAYIDDYREFSTAGMAWTDAEYTAITYDPLNRLVDVAPALTAPGYTAGYEYDEIGNLTYKREGTAPGLTYAYPVATNPRPHAVTALSDGSTFDYDGNGNMTQRVEISGTERITYTQGYDAENRLTVVTRTAGLSNTVTHFRYDGDGARIAQITDEGATLYAGDLYEEFHEAGTSVVTATHYYYLGAQRVAMRAGAALFYLHSDHLGSASLTTDAAGEVVSKQRYYPFGGVREQEGESPTDFGFTGQRLDDSTGLMYYRARYYAAGLGRFVSADAIVPGAGNPQSFNRYSYVLNNPLRYIDPTGHMWEDEIARACGIDTAKVDWEKEWENLDYYRKWFLEDSAIWNMLHDFELGDILKFEKDGFKLETMLVEQISSGKFVLWETQEYAWMTLGELYGADSWALYKNGELEDGRTVGYGSYKRLRGSEDGWVGLTPDREFREMGGSTWESGHIETRNTYKWGKALMVAVGSGLIIYGAAEAATAIAVTGGVIDVAGVWDGLDLIKSSKPVLPDYIDVPQRRYDFSRDWENQ